MGKISSVDKVDSIGKVDDVGKAGSIRVDKVGRANKASYII